MHRDEILQMQMKIDRRYRGRRNKTNLLRWLLLAVVAGAIAAILLLTPIPSPINPLPPSGYNPPHTQPIHPSTGFQALTRAIAGRSDP